MCIRAPNGRLKRVMGVQVADSRFERAVLSMQWHLDRDAWTVLVLLLADLLGWILLGWLFLLAAG